MVLRNFSEQLFFVVHHDSCFNYIARSVLTYFSKIMRLSCCISSSCLCSPCIRVQRMFLLNNFDLDNQIKFLLPPNKVIQSNTKRQHFICSNNYTYPAKHWKKVLLTLICFEKKIHTISMSYAISHANRRPDFTNQIAWHNHMVRKFILQKNWQSEVQTFLFIIKIITF